MRTRSSNKTIRHLVPAVTMALWLWPFAGCSTTESGPRYDPGLDDLAIVSVNPGTLLPGSMLVVEGRSFVDDRWGKSELWLDRSPRGGLTSRIPWTCACR